MKFSEGMRFIVFLLLFCSQIVLADPPAISGFYYDETGMSLQALNFDSEEHLRQQLLPEGLTEPYKRFRNYLYQEFVKGLPRAQMMLIVRDYLPMIVNSYHQSQPTVFSEQIVQYMSEKIRPDAYQEFSNYNVHFSVDSTGKFQVDGIEPNRLGVNTGRDVYFNLSGIMQKEQFNVSDAVQLWLHEILHSQPNISLEVRDEWAAKVSRWVRERTTEIELSSDRKVISIVLPSRPPRGENVGWSLADHYERTLKKRLLIFEQNQKESKVRNEIYSGFATFSNSLKQGAPNQKGNDYWPDISVNSIRKTPRGTLQIDYSQKLYRYDQINNQVSQGSGYEGIGYQGIMNVPSDQFRIEWNMDTSTVEISRSYKGDLAENDFEIYRIKDVGTKRMLSLRIKTQDMSALLQAKTLHLQAKNGSDLRPLSFEVRKLRVLNKNEALAHVEVPQQQMEISRILVPVIGYENEYSEIDIRSTQPLVLQGSMEKKEILARVEAVSIQDRIEEKDQVLLKVTLKNTKQVKGITFDLEHRMLGYQYEYVNGQLKSELKAESGLGRKYYTRKSEIRKIPNGQIQISIPEVDLTRTAEGPTIKNRISRFFTITHRDKMPYLKDSLNRKLVGLWIHYEDGTIEKVPVELLPETIFSLESEVARDDRWNKAIELATRRAKQMYDVMDSWIPPKPAETTVVSCQELF